MTTEEKIEKKAKEWTDHFISVQGSVYPLALEEAFEAGANFGRELGMKKAVSEVEKILLDLDWDDMSWGVDDLIKLIRRNCNE